MTGAFAELLVWEAFRALRLEGASLYEQLATHIREPRVLATQGPTLDIGGGDAHLWSIGGDALVRAVTARGELLITDADPDLVRRCANGSVGRHAGVRVERADVMALPYARRSFARVLATHVLHWCGEPARVRRAVDGIAAVLTVDGCALVTTVDEDVHMMEIYEAMRRAEETLAARGTALPIAIPSVSPRVLPFCAGNATTFLSSSFAKVERVELDYAHLVEATHPTGGPGGAEFVVEYIKTLPFIEEASRAGAWPESFFQEIADDVRAEIARAGCFRMSRRDVLYVCREPRERTRAAEGR